MAKKDKKKRKLGTARALVVHVTRVELRTTTEGGIEMNWHSDGEEAPEGAEEGGAQTGEAHASEGEGLRTLEHLERFHESDREEFSRMAAVQELGPQLREALNVLLTLTPEAVQTLAEITRLPAEERRLIRRAVDLPDEVRSALRGLLDE